MRNSRQREIIKTIIQSRDDHPSAAMLYEEIKRVDDTISLATVYRNLNLFVEQGILKKISIPGAADRYDRNLSAHSHFYCKECGRIIEIKNIQPLLGLRPIESRYNVEIREVQSLCIGICEECQKRKIK